MLKINDAPRDAAVTITINGSGAVSRRNNKTKADKLAAKAGALAALAAIKTRQAEQVGFMAQERQSLKQLKAAEGVRVFNAKARKDRNGAKRVAVSVLETDGQRRTVKRIVTTASKMHDDQKLPKYLRVALEAFAILVADGLGVATMDGHDSSNRLTGSYEPSGGGGGFASKTYTDRQLNGLAAFREMEKRIPTELEIVFRQIIGEEVGSITGKRQSLAELGEHLGYKHSQSSAAGGVQVYCVTTLIGHYMKEKYGDLD